MANHVAYGLPVRAHEAQRPLSTADAYQQQQEEQDIRNLKSWCDHGLIKLRFPSFGELQGEFVRPCRHDYGEGPKMGAVVRFRDSGYHGFYVTNGIAVPKLKCDAPAPRHRVEKVVVQTTRVVSAPAVVHRQVQVTREVSVLQRIFRR